MKQRKLERNSETKHLRAQIRKDFLAVGVLFPLCRQKGRGLRVSECHQPAVVSLTQAEPAVGVWSWKMKMELGKGGCGKVDRLERRGVGPSWLSWEVRNPVSRTSHSAAGVRPPWSSQAWVSWAISWQVSSEMPVEGACWNGLEVYLQAIFSPSEELALEVE